MCLIEFDYSKLRGKIKEVCKTESEFAKKLGISSVSLSKRLNCQIGFSESEIYKSCKILGVDVSQSYDYFFNKKLKKT